MEQSKLQSYSNYIQTQYPIALNYFKQFVTAKSWSAEKMAKHSLVISGSKIGAICNDSKWHTPLDVYMNMSLKKEPFGGNYKTRRGQALESEIAFEASELLQGHLGGGMELVHPDFAGFTCQIDETLQTPVLGVVIVECKWISYPTNEWGKGSNIDAGGNIIAEDSAIPQDYKDQVMWQLGIINACYADRAPKIAILSAVIKNEPAPRIYVIHYDEERFNFLMQKAEDFLFNNVIAGVAPEMTELELEEFQEKTNKNHQTIAGDYLNLQGDSQEQQLFEQSVRYSALNAQIAELKKEQDEIKQQIIASIGEHEGLIAYGNVIATYKSTKDKVKFNEKLFAEQHRELYEQYCETVKGSRIFSNKI